MDLEYDRKFEEMKKYIPFLESMIKRLESTSAASANPRQAQLDKIKSLRDLLLDKKKRMKMENLLKCEQVLINLYAKVEQRDALPGIKSVTDPAYQTNTKQQEDDLEVVRNKLKSVTTKRLDEEQDTLPEIARASVTEELCTPGSKEPALFQRRPNKASLSPLRVAPKSPTKTPAQTISKRNYTRILISPEKNSRRWDKDEPDAEKPLFSRRSPRRSPKRHSPTYHKKEKKKSKIKKSRDLNITLNVPEESLDSLNTKDILSRIMTCNDNDVDIETLREAKRQILTELKHTGANCDDISDLLLKSYKKKIRNLKQKDDVEEGELSDSESEAIESIYGGFMLDAEKSKSKENDSENKEKPRKIQICLVINSDKHEISKDPKDEVANSSELDLSDLIMFTEKPFNTNEISSNAAISDVTKPSVNTVIPEKETNEHNKFSPAGNEVQVDKTSLQDFKHDSDKVQIISLDESGKSANFYKPIQPTIAASTADIISTPQETEVSHNVDTKVLGNKKETENITEIAEYLKVTTEAKTSEQVEIPLLNEPSVASHKPNEDVVSEIDILQALKNEILGESLTVTESITPALHLPKFAKVASSAQEIVPKKRISIEKYKEKSVSVPKTVTPLFFNDLDFSSKDDQSKKQSLKLTMKECERFNFPKRLSLDEDGGSDGDNDVATSLDEIYLDLGPKSPDHKDIHNNGNKGPIIIPVDPIKGNAIPFKADVDMRTLTPFNPSGKVHGEALLPTPTNESTMKKDSLKTKSDLNKLPFDPRMRRDLNQANKILSSPHPHMMSSDRTPRPVPPPIMNYGNMTPNMGPIMLPNLSTCLSPIMALNMPPNMTMNSIITPSRNPNMTPNARSYEITNIDDNTNSKHVYAPIFPVYDQRENRDQSVAKETIQVPRWELNENEPRTRWDTAWESTNNRDLNRDVRWEPADICKDVNRDPRSSSVQRENPEYNNSRFNDTYNSFNNSRYNNNRRDSYNRQDCPQTSIPSFVQSDSAIINQPYNNLDVPRTPIHSFGISECPTTPSHQFGRTDCPSTPSHPFGRLDGPPTPSHSFGRLDCPPTPSHSFGRLDCPPTPNHSFGRSDNYGRDPRLNRSADHDSLQREDRDRNYHRDRSSSHYNSYKQDGNRPYSNSDSYKNYREQSVGRNKHDKRDHVSRYDSCTGRTPKDQDNERMYSRERVHGRSGDRRFENENRKRGDFSSGRDFQRERSVSRSRLTDEKSNRFYRASSVGKNFHTDDSTKKLSVKPHTGRSFTIDTSVNSTFQDFLNSSKEKHVEVSDYNFDVRRQRAASVGRSLGRESSVGRSYRRDRSFGEKEIDQTRKLASSFPAHSNKNNFRRACSVGRDIGANAGKSFKDIKADFESYKLNYDAKYLKKTNLIEYNRKIEKKISSTETSYKNAPRSKNNKHDTNNVEDVGKKLYSPRKNNRDPRLRRDVSDNKNKDYSHKEHDKKHIGIVYYNDNITKGTIMGSGYGVKNYKIPKIKRPVEEKRENKEEVGKIETTKEEENKKKEKNKKEEEYKKEEEKNKKEEENEKLNYKESNKLVDKKIKISKTDLKLRPAKVKLNILEETEKRVTRSNRRSGNQSLLSDEDDNITNTRKSKKSVIYDSDSGTELQEKEENDAESKILDKTTVNDKIESKIEVEKSNPISQNCEKIESPPENESNVKIKAGVSKDIVEAKLSLKKIDNSFVIDDKQGDQSNSSFGIDDLEIFSDNITSDPVIDDSINALIAGLDNDIGPSKTVTPTSFSNEMTIENILESMTGVPHNDKVMTELNDISEVIKNDLSESKKSDVLKNSLLAITSESDSVLTETKSVKDDSNNVTNVPETHVTIDKRGEAKQTINVNLLESECQEGPTNHLSEHSENNSNKMAIGCENIVSTTELEKDNLLLTESKKDDSQNLDRSSTPDSTNEITSLKSKQGESLPDSTIELQNETNSVVTSSHDSDELVDKQNMKSSSLNKNPLLNNIENLFSFLQDKTKLKQILSILGDQTSENEKIKKKLEKLSEIVSDDEETKEEIKKINEKDDSVEQYKNKLNTSEKDNLKQDKIISELNEASLKDNNDYHSECGKNTVAANENEPNALEKKDDGQGIKEGSAKDVALDNINDGNVRDTVKKGKTKVTKKIKGKKGRVAKKGKLTKANQAKRVTRSGAASLPSASSVQVKKPNRELLKLQRDIKEFISDDDLNATGIRMCRLAKLVDDKAPKFRDDSNSQDSSSPVVVLEELKQSIPELPHENSSEKGGKKKATLNLSKMQNIDSNKMIKPSPKYKPGPKSKTKVVHKLDEEDPYAFESDSISETTVKSTEGKKQDSSDSENESLASSKSFESENAPSESKKKPKRKRYKWQAGIIKKQKRKKPDMKSIESPRSENILVSTRPKSVTMPDMNCFTDKTYCFHKNLFTYSCRLCAYTGDDIVNHYKQQHPHSEIPLSRLSPDMAKEAIEQCEEINFQAISKIPTEKYVCRFCFKEFSRKKAVLEAFFWHIVSMHTGEYKQLCSLCVNVSRCPFNLDIPPPPKDIKGQLIGYICEKCNFTQISLENLKTHVIVRHNDEQTEVYTINLAAMSKKTINSLLKQCSASIEEKKPRVLRSSRSNQSMTEASDDHSDITDSDATDEPLASRRKCIKDISASPDEKPKINYQSKITFENEVSHDNVNKKLETLDVKIEREEEEHPESPQKSILEHRNDPNSKTDAEKTLTESAENTSDDIFDYPHFKINYTNSGSKEYVCCINGKDSHYKTSLLISMKKHVQTKHSEIWDGYCFLCKVIVTPQGNHTFKDCLQHYLDKHMDSFPILEKSNDETEKLPEAAVGPVALSKSYINVRPISELISGERISLDEMPNLKIESVVSLGAQTVEPPQISPSYPSRALSLPPQEKEHKYEEIQAEVMTKKHRVVLETMMSRHKLLNVFKCAGRFCSFTTNAAEDALLHASTHQRVGGENSLMCAYCDFDCCGNAIDLVMHVFNSHSECPYACAYCIYRAAASQVVAAHINRVHAQMPVKVLALPNAAALPTQSSLMLPREHVVLHYACPHACKFRTYTAGKYCEHLQQRHATEEWHPCYLCAQKQSSPSDLIHHLKSHDLNVYQCTWCLHGADSEAALMSHTSQKHPDKQPQAYLRVITNKDGSSEYRVLPLASFNKSKVFVEEVPLVVSNEDPAREAERSIDLEKLIGHTNQIIDMSNAPKVSTPQINTEIEDAVANITIPETIQAPQAPLVTTVSEPLEILPPPRLVTPPTVMKDTSQLLTPKIKAEPLETPSKNISNEVVYCLDSDDEDSTQSIIALSDDESTTSGVLPKQSQRQDPQKQFKIVSRAALFKCGKCSMTFKNNGGFKKHLGSCFGASKFLNCAYCESTFSTRDQLVTHYVTFHTDALPNQCGVCFEAFSVMNQVKKHMKLVHKVTKYIVASNMNERGDFVYTLTPRPVAPKRKLSSTSSEPPVKLKRFSPQDIDQLPINPILDECVHCSLCEFQTKVRLNMVRHLQFHAEQQPVPQTAPVNPVPHLETNEKHFDRMVNLASSSIVNRTPEKSTRPESTTTVSLLVPPEAAAVYPKYVPDRQRLTCGAKGCSYISVDIAMLRNHWQTLHSSSYDFHCVHCPPHQYVDKTKPLSATRIVAHLKMHGPTLYSCSICPYYHYRKQMLEKHLLDKHNGDARVMTVREAVSVSPTPTTSASQATVFAPTMDLKPWQCGLCNFKSMLRPEVVEHCAKVHLSKMQYKCSYCPFRTSAIENVTKHQSNSHPGRNEEIFYYYYREGSIPDENDGMPRWMRQFQKMNPEPHVKSEVADPRNSALAQLLTTTQKPVAAGAVVDLNIVKKEVGEEVPNDASLEELCNKHGQFCEPNGLKYKCPLCKVVVEDTIEAMQSHLYEELKYRKWACAICSYKAFHKIGLKDHIISEHRGQNQEPTLLPLDNNIEKWVAGLIDHQTKSIIKNKENLLKQKILTERPPPPPPPPAPSTSSDKTQEKPSDKFSMLELEQAFGQLGVPSSMAFSCPKCSYTSKDEVAMRDHLEGELTKIRWCCSSCTDNFQNYHEAQFHCKSMHSGVSVRPKEAVRDPTMRSSWVSAVIQVQRLNMKGLPVTSDTSEKEPKNAPDAAENSLLVFRYAEKVSTPEEAVLSRKRPAPSGADSDDEKLVIDEPKETASVARKKTTAAKCPHCDFQTKYSNVLKEHTFRHFKIKPYNCAICGINGHRQKITNHLLTQHKGEVDAEMLTQYIVFATLPGGETYPLQPSKSKTKKVAEEDKLESRIVCLLCDKSFTESEAETHVHEKANPQFAKKGDVVVKCCICLALRLDLPSLQEHHCLAHPKEPILNYAFYKMMHETRETHCCDHCNNRFRFIRDLRSHHDAMHPSLTVKFSTIPYTGETPTTILDSDDDLEAEKRQSVDSVPSGSKKVARKSTTKLPAQTVAKKSTTKLPFDVASESDDEFTYYGTKPAPLDRYENVSTRMSLCNTTMPVSMKQLSELFKINPSVVIKDCREETLPSEFRN